MYPYRSIDGSVIACWARRVLHSQPGGTGRGTRSVDGICAGADALAASLGGHPAEGPEVIRRIFGRPRGTGGVSTLVYADLEYVERMRRADHRDPVGREG
jgi:hypothetical protein